VTLFTLEGDRHRAMLHEPRPLAPRSREAVVPDRIVLESPVEFVLSDI